MGRERCLLAATGARSSVTRTIDTRPTHGAVVCFNFDYSRRLGKFDTDVSFFWGGSRVACKKRPRSSFFHARLAAHRNKKKRRGSRKNLPKRGKERDTGGVPYGQLNQNYSRLCRLDNLERRNWWETGDIQLFNLSKDLAETTDLAKSHPEKAASLKKKLFSYLEDIDAQLPAVNDDYDPATDPARLKGTNRKKKK